MLLTVVESVVLGESVSFQIAHVLINVNDLGVVLLNLRHEALNQFSEFRIDFPDGLFVTLEVLLDVSEELLEVLRVVHDQLADDGLVQVN